MSRFPFLHIMACFFGLLHLNAQYTDVINSNRPGVSKSAYALGSNVFQIELGGSSIQETHQRLNYDTKGFGIDFELRYGLLLENLEIILAGEYRNDKININTSQFSQSDSRANFRHFSFAVKYLLYDYFKNKDEKPNLYSYHANNKFKWNRFIPSVAIIGGVNYDTKNNPFTPPGTEGVSPNLGIALQNNFTGNWVLVTNILMNRLFTTAKNLDGSTITQFDGIEYKASDFQIVTTLTHAFLDKWVAFAEYQVIKSDFYSDNLARFGGAYLWNKNFQIDAGVTINFKDTPTVFQILAGVSYRFDFHKDKIIVEDE